MKHLPFLIHFAAIEQPSLYQLPILPNIDSVTSCELGIREHFDGYVLLKQKKSEKKFIFKILKSKDDMLNVTKKIRK